MGSKHYELSVGNPPEEMSTRPPSQQEDGHQHPPQNDAHEEETSPLSPLLLEDTLQVILRHVSSFGDLKGYRLVNTTWNRAATRVLRTRPAAWIVFDKNEELEMRKYSFEDMKRLLDILETSSWLSPFTKVCVDTSFYQVDPEWQHEKQAVVERFFRAVGPFVKKLQLFESSITGGNRLFPSAPAPTDIPFPVLEKLNFELQNDEFLFYGSGTRIKPVFPAIRESNLDFVRSILANSPRLMEVQLGHPDWYYTDGSDLLCLTHLSRPLPKLALYSRSLEKQFTLLEKVGAVRQLREFRLHLRDPHQPPDPHFSEALTRFLHLRRDTLEVLVVEVKSHLRIPLGIPELPRLKKLSLGSFECPCSIRHSFPALQQLTLIQRPHMPPMINFAEIARPMEALTSLELGLPHLPTTDFFGHVARVMPHLRKLTFTEMWPPVNGRLTVSFGDLEPLQNVEELCFTCGWATQSQVDTLLTGLSAEDLAVWKGYSAERLKTESAKASDLPAFLQRIKRLTINTNTGYPVIVISDVSCRLVLLKMANLKCLDLGKCLLNPPEISVQVLLEMRSRFRVLPPHLPTIEQNP